MATYAIGDIQGCYDELRQLLDAIKFDPTKDHLWFSGDLVNRGPDSLATLRFVRSLGKRAISVLGNHDLHLLAVAATSNRLHRVDASLMPVLDSPDCHELLDWLRQLPLLHHDPHSQVTLIHAGLPPDWDLETAKACATEAETVLRGTDYKSFLGQMYGDLPDQWNPGLTGWPRLRFIVNCFTRLRYCTSKGQLALEHKGAPEHHREGLLPWFQHPQRQSQGQRFIFGHWSTLGRIVWKDDRVWGLDSGCVWGGCLTALRIDREPWQITQLPCPARRKPGRS